MNHSEKLLEVFKGVLRKLSLDELKTLRERFIELHEDSVRMSRLVRAQIEEVIVSQRRSEWISKTEAESLLATAREGIASHLEKLSVAYRSKSWWTRWVGPDVEALALENAMGIQAAFIQRLDQWAKIAESGELPNRAKVVRGFGEIGILEDVICRSIATVEEIRHRCSPGEQNGFFLALNGLLAGPKPVAKYGQKESP